MSRLALISGRLERLRGRLLLFAPVCLGSGIATYFRLPVEPGALAWALIGLGALALMLIGLRYWPTRWTGLASLAFGLALVLGGLLAGGLRTETTRAPVLDFRYYGPVEGRIVTIDRSASEAVRLTLDRLRLDRVRPDELPVRVRVSLHGTQGFLIPEPGQRIAMTAFLSAPEGPVEPGGFDFRRMAWFDRIGAVGYTRAPALMLAPAETGLGGLVISRLRARIAQAVQAIVPGEEGAFAAAILTGDRTGIAPATLAALRGSNLSHLLAISGLHMGLLTGFVFTALRYVMALIPGFAAHYPIRKIAAVGALQAGAFYLALSGGNVATERAFVMVAVMFGAVLLDRRALTLRAVAVAALILLAAQPEALAEPGFQMSFSATTALVAVFGWLRDWDGPRLPRWLRPVSAVVISSAVAGAATAPYAAAHFNQVSHFGLVANLLAVPVMGTLVMPGAVLAAVLTPAGLAGLALNLIRWPIAWILAVAERVSGMEGALGHVPSPAPVVLGLITAGGLFAVLATGRLRALALAPLVLGFAIWSDTTRPDVLVSSGGGLVGSMTPAGRALSKERGEGFAAASWLENDGDAVAQVVAFRRGQDRDGAFRIGAARLVHLTGQGAAARVAAACAEADIVVVTAEVPEPPAGCAVYDKLRLAETGALALHVDGEGLRIVTEAEMSGQRPWTRR
ncbi:ComEC/Rec2 family competence protein [Maritimibacter fusiformis]|uniref:DUF4131 domain-containing protein n=1 Tax=Maritimibacter fusiformis TaxID=2603819 RepID=A0A5D0RML4_9RHOB|nr:ComEC/Rec2 family competence protein [Maritimibacter fusiformis]TYB82762.1 DUF4131 domain-containing protein [Maritimibacter fusiformis]